MRRIGPPAISPPAHQPSSSAALQRISPPAHQPSSASALQRISPPALRPSSASALQRISPPALRPSSASALQLSALQRISPPAPRPSSSAALQLLRPPAHRLSSASATSASALQRHAARSLLIANQSQQGNPSPIPPPWAETPGGLAPSLCDGTLFQTLAWPSKFAWPATWPCRNCLKSICATSTISIGLPMTARIQFPLRYLQHLRLWPTDQANPYPYTREKREESEGKFNRLEKLLPLGHLATWPVSHLSLPSHSVSTRKYFGPNLLICWGLAETCKILLERILLACDSSAVNQNAPSLNAIP